MNIFIIIFDFFVDYTAEIIVACIGIALVVYFSGFAVLGWPAMAMEFLGSLADPTFGGWGAYILLALAVIIPIVMKSPKAFFVTLTAYALLYTFGDAVINGGSVVDMAFGLFMGVMFGCGLAVIPAAILSALTD